MPRARRQMFIWIPRTENSNYKVEIDGVDRTDDVVEASFTDAIVGEESAFRIRLENNAETFSNLYSGGEQVDFYLDFGTATNKRFSGKIEIIKKEFGEKGNIILLEGTNRFHSELLDITVTGDFNGTSADDILKSMNDTYLTGFTTTNIDTFNETPTLKWEDIPFYDAIIDLCNAADADCYVDTDGDFHLFKRESVINDDEAVVQGDNLIQVNGLQDNLVDVKNSIRVVSEDDEGLPILYTSEDATSQSDYGLKQSVLKETDISNTDQAQEFADFQRTDNPETRGKSVSFFLPSIKPGDFIWIVNPQQNIHSQYRMVQFTHKIPDQTTETLVAQSRDLPTFLKNRRQREASISTLKNPNQMKWSYNFPFDNLDNIDDDASNNTTVSNGALIVESGTSGTMVSNSKQYPSTLTEAHLQVVGENLDNATYRVSVDGGDNFQSINKDQRITMTDTGSEVIVEVKVSSATTVIKSLAMLLK